MTVWNSFASVSDVSEGVFMNHCNYRRRLWDKLRSTSCGLSRVSIPAVFSQLDIDSLIERIGMPAVVGAWLRKWRGFGGN